MAWWLVALIGAVGLVFLAKTLAWGIQRRTGNAGIVDAIWALALGSLAPFFALMGAAPAPLRALLALMGGVWGLRLGWHLWRRNWGAPEDFRYAKLRADWGASAQAKMFWFFQFQNIFTLLLAASAFLTVAAAGAMPAWPWIAVAVLIWGASLWGEGVADAQMERFRRKPANRGKVCDVGLWRYSRHPNYFFEAVHWSAYVPLALGAQLAEGALLGWGWASLAAPIIMAWLLMKLSGVPLLETEMMRRKPGYADYVARTSALIPWPPRNGR